MDTIVKTANLDNRILANLLSPDSAIDGFNCHALSGIVDFRNNRLLLLVLIVKANYQEKFREERVTSVEVSLDEFRKSGDAGVVKPDFYAFKLEEYGHSVIFGDYEASTEAVCYMGGVKEPTEFIDKMNIRYRDELIAISDHLTDSELNSLKKLKERYPNELQGNSLPT